MDYMNRNTTNVMVLSRVGMTSALADLFYGLTNGKDAIDISADTATRVERIFLFCLFWTVGGCLDVPSRHKMDEYIRAIDAKFMPQLNGPEETIYEYFVDTSGEWAFWKLTPTGEADFSNLLSRWTLLGPTTTCSHV